MQPKVIAYGTEDYKSLEAVAKLLEVMSPHGAIYEVRDVYFDYGQDWMWTTICRKGWRECQVLSPREWEDILFAENIGELAQAAENIRNGKWFADR